MGSWKKFIMGEKMPDKDDPKYKEKYEKDVDAGRKFARWSGIDRLAASVQGFANKHTKALCQQAHKSLSNHRLWLCHPQFRHECLPYGACMEPRR